MAKKKHTKRGAMEQRLAPHSGKALRDLKPSRGNAVRGGREGRGVAIQDLQMSKNYDCG